MAASSSRSSVSSSRTVTPTMPWPAAGTMASGSSTTARPVGQAEPLQAGIGEQRGGAGAGGQLVEPGLHVAAQRGDGKVRAGVQQLRLAADRGGADRPRPPAGWRTGRPDRRAHRVDAGSARRGRPRAAACRRARCRAATRSPGPSGCAPRSRCGGRRAPRGSPWRTGPCRRSRPGGGPAPRRRWCGWRAPRTRPCRAAPGRSGSGRRGSRGSGSAPAASRGCRPAAAAHGCAASPWRGGMAAVMARVLLLSAGNWKDRTFCGCARCWASRPPATRPRRRCWTRMGACWPRRC